MNSIWHPTQGRGTLYNADGSIAWQEDWQQNNLHNAGEQSVLDVYFREQSNPTKYLALLNDSSVVETDGTMSAVTEVDTPATNGYTRQQILAAQWSVAALDAGDMQIAAPEKTFGAFTAGRTISHAALCTTSTGAGILILTIALTQPITVGAGQTFGYTLRTKAQ